MIRGAHFLLHSPDPAADRAFLRDVLQFSSVDSGGGWLIFRLPDAELAVHPAEAVTTSPHADSRMPRAELYLMCEDLSRTVADLTTRGATVGPVTIERWGKRTHIDLPSGLTLGLYQPSHPVAIDWP